MKYIYIHPAFIFIFIIVLVSCESSEEQEEIKDYKISPVPFTQVQLNDNFWLPRIIKNAEITIPIAFRHCETTDRINNFAVAGGLVEGEHKGKRYNDSDVFKIMEGTAYSLSESYDEKLDLYLDSLIMLIGAAQEDDGYLYTARTINPDKVPEYSGTERWSFLEQSHELYNVGHMYEAAVAHFQATGKRTFLDIAIKSANFIDKEFGWEKIEMYPGHQGIEIGLVKLYRITGDNRYLDLAKFFLDVRGPGGKKYMQSHLKVVEQNEPVGHAVRALYMYSGMADVAALTGDPTYLTAINTIWENVVNKKMYITGGLGQTGGNEGFGPDYELPNLTAYCETCASIANVFWNHRMFLLSGDAKYIDVMERTMYNALLAGVSLSGDRFFYPNPLESDSSHDRKEWFGCACCPSNISRFLPSFPGYIYAHNQNDIYVNLYTESETSFKTSSGTIYLSQSSDYPWDGNVIITINPENQGHYNMLLRIPGWARNKPVPGNLYHYKRPLDKKVVIYVNGIEIDYNIKNGYATISREWSENDIIHLYMPMPINEVLALKKVKENEGKFAIQRGPIVYCLEEKDQDSIDIKTIMSVHSTGFTTQFESDLLNGVQTINFFANSFYENSNGSIKIDRTKHKIKAIPYCVWANRGAGDMLVWIPYKKKNEIN